MGTLLVKISNSDNSVEVSKARIGTRCQYCGEPIFDFIEYGKKPLYEIEDDTGIRFEFPGETKPVFFVHKECLRHISYGTDTLYQNMIKGKATKSGFRFGFEMEAMYKYNVDKKIADAAIIGIYGGVPTSDCSVDVEYKFPNSINLHGLRMAVDGMARYVTFDDPHCGHHIHVSHDTWDSNKVETISTTTSPITPT